MPVRLQRRLPRARLPVQPWLDALLLLRLLVLLLVLWCVLHGVCS